MPGTPADRVHSAEFWKLAEELLARGKLQTHPVRVVSGCGGCGGGAEDAEGVEGVGREIGLRDW